MEGEEEEVVVVRSGRTLLIVPRLRRDDVERIVKAHDQRYDTCEVPGDRDYIYIILHLS